MLVFGAPISVSQDATQAVNLLYCRSLSPEKTIFNFVNPNMLLLWEVRVPEEDKQKNRSKTRKIVRFPRLCGGFSLLSLDNREALHSNSNYPYYLKIVKENLRKLCSERNLNHSLTF